MKARGEEDLERRVPKTQELFFLDPPQPIRHLIGRMLKEFFYMILKKKI